MNEAYTFITEEQRVELYEFYLSINKKDIDKYDVIKFFCDFYMLLGEIDNGGIHQYLINNSGDCFNNLNNQLLHYGFKNIHDQLNLVKKRISVELMPKDRGERNELLDKYGDDQYKLFDDIDGYFQDNSSDIEVELYSFFRNNIIELNV